MLIKMNFKTKLYLRVLLIALFFAWIGPSIFCALLAVPNLLFIKEKESPSLLVKYSLRGLEAAYILCVFNVFMSLKYELKTSYFYQGMSIYERISTSVGISIVVATALILMVMCYDFLLQKIMQVRSKTK